MGLIVTVDGPGGSGKGTICKIASRKLGYPYLDTGLLYRAVAFKLISSKTENIMVRAVDFAERVGPDDLHNASLRDPEVSDLASKVAVIPEVRKKLLNFQIEFSKDPRGAILDGRDLGVKVCPGADIKIFLTASLDIRAERRWLEIRKLNPLESFRKVRADLKERDARDKGRALSPLIKPKDALLIDTSELTIDASVKLFVNAVREKIKNNSIKRNKIIQRPGE